MRTGGIGFGRGLAALALLAGLAATLATGAPASAATTSVTIHKAVCSTEAGNLFDECHGNTWAGVPFTIGGAARTTNSKGVAAATVTAGKIKVAENAAWITDGGQYIYCSVPSTGRVLFNAKRTGGAIFLNVKAGEKVVCDWYNLVKPTPKGIGLRIHAFTCPADTSGDIFTACHKSANAKKYLTFTAWADAGAVAKKTSITGKLSVIVPTASTGKVSLTIAEPAGAVTQDGAFVFCSSDASEPGSGDVLGGVTVFDGDVTVKVKDGTTFTCDWYNLT